MYLLTIYFLSEPRTFSKENFWERVCIGHHKMAVWSVCIWLASNFVSLQILNCKFLSLSVDEFSHSSLMVLMGLMSEQLNRGRMSSTNMESGNFKLWAKFTTSEKGKKAERDKRKKRRERGKEGKEGEIGRKKEGEKERDKETKQYREYADGRNWYPEISWWPMCFHKESHRESWVVLWRFI